MNVTDSNLVTIFMIGFVIILYVIIITAWIGMTLIEKKYNGKKANQQSS